MNETITASVIQNDDSNENNPNKGPGSRLRKAREEAGLSLEEISKNLYINTAKIIAIENNDYSKVAGLTFTRGYLRSYSRLLGLPIDEILKEFDNLGLVEKPGRITTQTLYKKRNMFTERLISWMTGLLTLIFIVLVVMWWQSQQNAQFEGGKVMQKPPTSNQSQVIITPPLQSNHSYIAPIIPTPSPVIVPVNSAPVSGVTSESPTGGGNLPNLMPGTAVSSGQTHTPIPIASPAYQNQPNTTSMNETTGGGGGGAVPNQSPITNSSVTMPASANTSESGNASASTSTTPGIDNAISTTHPQDPQDPSASRPNGEVSTHHHGKAHQPIVIKPPFSSD